MKVFSCPRGMPESRMQSIRAHLEFSRLPCASSTVIMRTILVAPRISRHASRSCLTCAAHALTLAHLAMDLFPFGSLAEITREIRSKNVSPLAIVELYLKRIEALQPKLNGFAHLDARGARKQA